MSASAVNAGSANNAGYKLISFDLDGTLVDTASEIAEAANLSLADFGLPRRPAEEVTLLIGAGAHALMRKLLAQAREKEGGPWDAVPEADVIARFDHHYAFTSGTQSLPYLGCVDTLEQLRAAGVRLACITNKEARFAQLVLDAHGLSGYFDLLIGGDTLPVKKPDRAVIAHALAVFGVSPAQAAHVGDSRTDVEAARNAGVAAWAVPFGYNSGQPIETANPDLIFDTLPDVAEHVLAGPARARTA